MSSRFAEEQSGCEHAEVRIRTVVTCKHPSEGGQFEKNRGIGISPSFFIKWENCGEECSCVRKNSPGLYGKVSQSCELGGCFLFCICCRETGEGSSLLSSHFFRYPSFYGKDRKCAPDNQVGLESIRVFMKVDPLFH